MQRSRSDDMVIARAERAMALTRSLVDENERLRQELAQRAGRAPGDGGSRPPGRRPAPVPKPGTRLNP